MTNRRVNELDFRLTTPNGENLVVFSYGSGMQAVNGGEYLRQKYWKKNRRWIQIVLAKTSGYGHRWNATEGIFSAIKRVFEEQIKATTEKGMLQETANKIWAYQKLQRA